MKKKSLHKILSLVMVILMLSAMTISASATGFPSFRVNLNTSAVVQPDQPLLLTVYAEGAEGITYQWYVNNEKVEGETGNQFNAKYTKDVVVYCEATAGNYSLRSNECRITVGTGTPTVTPTPAVTAPLSPAVGVVVPTITKQPASVKLAQGQSATLSVAATCANLGAGLQLCYQWYISSTNSAATASPIPNATQATYTTNPADGEKYYLVAVWSTNGQSNSSVAYSNLISVTYGSNEFKITKHPTGETVEAGGSALFIARADNAAKLEWRIVSKDTTNTIPASQAAYYFKGLSVSGENTEGLSLVNIPAEMNDWAIECKFTAADGRTLFTNGAILRVKSAVSPVTTPTPAISSAPAASPAPNAADSPVVIQAPVITTQPSGAVLAEGETVTLSVGASGEDAANGVTLQYQWYRNTANTNANGTAIAGATQESYTPDTISGSRYYYVAVKATNGSMESRTTYSNPVTVTYTAPIQTPAPTPEQSKDKDNSSSGLGSLIIAPIIAIVVAATAIGVGMFFLLRSFTQKKEDEYGQYQQDPQRYYQDDEFDQR